MKHLDYSAPIIPGGSFTWGEYAFLHEWGVMAIPTERQKQNAIILFTHLQALRKELGKPLTITSGARTPKYTEWLRSHGTPGAATRSPHMDWQAVDLQCPNIRTVNLWAFCDARWPGRMENFSSTPTWVHIDIRNWGERRRFNP